MPHFIIVLILYMYINSLNLSWIKKCLFLRNMEPLKALSSVFQSNRAISQIEIETKNEARLLSVNLALAEIFIILFLDRSELKI